MESMPITQPAVRGIALQVTTRSVPMRPAPAVSNRIVGVAQLFADLLPSDYTKILSQARTQKIARRQTIYFAGDTVKEVLLLSEGCMKITLLTEAGGAVILRLVGPGEIIGTVGLTTETTHSSSAEALVPSKVLVWNGSTFEQLLEQFPILRRNTVRIMEQRLAVLEERFREVSTQQVAQRVARQLVRLLPQVGQEIDGAIEIKLSREDLAQMTGTTLFTVSRLLSNWEQQGIVSLRRLAVVIRNPMGLLSICEIAR
jgi:CRP/FNR family transcriptional regulator, nitrogen oxide reductase regulator